MNGSWPRPEGFSANEGGWWPDPAGGGGMRWWDGHTWTGLTRPPLEDLAPAPSLRSVLVALAAISVAALALGLLIAAAIVFQS